MEQHNEPTVTSKVNKTPSSSVVEVTTESGEAHLSAGVIVLQWLSYAFWGWLIVALIWLLSIVLANAITGKAVDGIAPYAMAAVIVLLPIAFVTDLFYRKHELLRKEGAATVIMVIHAVIFALLAIGSLITTVFIGLSLLIGTGSQTDTQTISLLVAAFTAAAYAFVFVRVLNPFKTSQIAKLFSYIMLGISLVLIAFGIAGPIVKSISLRDDRRIETQLSGVEDAVSSYIKDNKKLPDNLETLDYSSSDTKALVDEGLVRYKKEASVPIKSSALSKSSQMRTKYRYQLCVTYKQQSRNFSKYTYNYNRNTYANYLSTYSHDAGDTCYKLETSVYDIDNF